MNLNEICNLYFTSNYLGVPTECLDWCRGQPVDDDQSEICAISHSKTINDCFHSGKDNLPGLPLNVTVRGIDAHKAMVWWNLPAKNPGAVDLYRVFWRPVGSKSVNKTDSIQRKVTLTELTPGKLKNAFVAKYQSIELFQVLCMR